MADSSSANPQPPATPCCASRASGARARSRTSPSSAQGRGARLRGLVGAGRTDVGLALFGIAPADRGVDRAGRAAPHGPLARGRRCGRASHTCRRTAGSSGCRCRSRSRRTSRWRRSASTCPASRLLDRCGRARGANAFREQLTIRTPSLDSRVEQLSGGNQQKTMLGEVAERRSRACSSSTSRRAASTSAPRPRCTRSSTSWPRAGIAIILDLVRPARGAGDERPRPGHARGPAGGDARAREATEERVITAAMGRRRRRR